MIKFLSIPGELLQNPELNSAHKLVLSYLLNLATSERYFFGSTQYLADAFGCSIQQVESAIKDLIKFDLISRDAAGACRLTVTSEELYSFHKPTKQEVAASEVIQKKTSQLAQIYQIRKQG